MQINKYCKRPITIEAVHLIDPCNPQEIADWCGGKVCQLPASHPAVDLWIEIPTLEGVMRANYGDFIIKEPFPARDRKFYPCKPSIFAATYEVHA